MEHSRNGTEGALTGTLSGQGKRPFFGSPEKIFSWYGISFLFLAALVVGFIWHDLRGEYRDTLDYWNVQLSTSADDQVRISALWLNERRVDTLAVAASNGTVSLISAVESKDHKVEEIRQGEERGIAHIAAVNGFLGGAVADSHCQIVGQVGLRPEMAKGVQEACRRVVQGGEYRVDTFGMEQGHVWLSLAAPVRAETRASFSAPIARRIVGSVIMVTENWQDIVPFFASVSIPKGSSETYVVWKRANETLIFSPRLEARGAPSFFRRPLKSNSFESRAALDGDVAFGEFTNYRGQAVYGVARRTGVPGYSLAREVNRDEALSAYHQRRLLGCLVGTLSFLLLGSVIVALHRYAATRDLEERIRQQEALTEKERRYRVLFESAGDGIFLMRGDHFVDCNQKSLELFGCGRDQLIGGTPWTFSPPRQPNGRDSLEAAKEKISLALQGQHLHFEWRHLRRDGTPFDAEVTLSNLEIAGEAHILALVRDVTEQKRAQEALRESEERFRTTFENAGIGIALVDMRGHPLKCNSALQRMLGYSEEELGGMAFTEFTHPNDQGVDWELFSQLAAGNREKYEIEKRYIKKDGQVVWGLLTASIVRDAQGTPYYAVGMVEDITERKRAEEELQRSRDQMRALAARLQSIGEEERKRVARDIHDQLGQALTALKLDLSFLLHEIPDDQREPMKRASSVLKLVDETIQSVRRISTELRPGMLDDLGLVATVEWAGEDFEARTGTKCRLNLPPDDLAVDPDQATALFRIFQETLTNVARHAGASEVEVRLARENGDLTLEVHDNGKGIPEDKISSGASLGILGMRERAVLLGGEITIRGSSGNGTTVRVRIPEARHT